MSNELFRLQLPGGKEAAFSVTEDGKVQVSEHVTLDHAACQFWHEVERQFTTNNKHLKRAIADLVEAVEQDTVSTSHWAFQRAKELVD